MSRIGLFLLSSLLLAACEDVGSGDILTSGIYADLSVTATGDGTSIVSAKLKSGGPNSNTYVELEGNDVLTATANGETKTMEDEYLVDADQNFHRYVASFDTEAADTSFVVSFAREIDDGAPQSTITLPAPFEVDEPASSFQRSTAATIAWSPSGTSDHMRLTASGTCIYSYSIDISGDPGTYTLEGGTLEAVDDDEQQSCKVTYTLDRWREGSVDPGFGEGGTALGHQLRSVVVETLP